MYSFGLVIIAQPYLASFECAIGMFAGVKRFPEVSLQQLIATIKSGGGNTDYQRINMMFPVEWVYRKL
jgi:hypothetical protein